jgi:RHS repeat-associated protein
MVWDPTLPIPQMVEGDGDGGVNGITAYGRRAIATSSGIYYAYDHQDSIIAGTANPYSPTDYGPYGESVTSHDWPLYAGYRGESTFGLNEQPIIHLRNRDYDPTTGTFLTRDPIDGQPGTPDEANAYDYVGNDPLNYTDPLGLSRVCDSDPLWSERGGSTPLSDNGGHPLEAPTFTEQLQWKWEEPPLSGCGTLTPKAWFTSQRSPSDPGHIGNLERNWVQASFSKTSYGTVQIDHIIISQVQAGCFPVGDFGGSGGGSSGSPGVVEQAGAIAEGLDPWGESCGNAPRSRWVFDTFSSGNVWGPKQAAELEWRNPCGDDDGDGIPIFEANLQSGPTHECFDGRRAYAVIDFPQQREGFHTILRVAEYPLSDLGTILTGAEPSGAYSAAQTQLSLWALSA